jgi:Zn-dependent protease with chaperone function
MAIASRRRPVTSSATRVQSPASGDRPQPAARAAAHVARASLLLGGLGLVSAIFVLATALEAWHVTPLAASHRISIFGQQVSYPVANAEAIVSVALAAVGLMVIALAARGALTELAAARRFQRQLAQRNPRPLRGGALVIEDEHPHAFCAGLAAPRVYLSTGAVRLLDGPGLDAVLAHEQHHARRRDPLRLATGRVLARALVMVPGLRELFLSHQNLAELSADESAVDAAPENRSGLAAAMLSFADAAPPDRGVGIDPSRIDYLLGEPPSWRFPLALCLVSAAVMALLVAVGVLAARVAHGSATLAAPFLSRQPCVVVLAGIPVAVVLLVAVAIRAVRRAGPAPAA